MVSDWYMFIQSLLTVFTRYSNFLIALKILTDALCKFCARNVRGGVTS
jgi:hypothetical protein